MKEAYLDVPYECLRLSSVLRRCRDHGEQEAAEEVERVAAKFSAFPTHGKIEDPIVGIVGNDQIAIACPLCSVLVGFETDRRGASCDGREARGYVRLQ